MITGRVSVVIPAYNAARWLPETLDSVLAQTAPPREVIVVDDGSSDDTEQVLAPFRPRINYLKQKNGGPAVARNAGIRASSGEFIALLDADDLWRPDKLAKQLAVLDAHPDTGVVFSNYEPFGEPVGYRTGFERSPVLAQLEKMRIADDAFLLKDDVFAALLQDLFSWTSTLLIRRTAIDEAGPFDEALRMSAEDWTMCLRLSRVTGFAYVNKCLARRREHPGSLSRIAPDNEQAVVALRNLLPFRALESADRARTTDHLARLLFDNGYHALKDGKARESRRYLIDYLRLSRRTSAAFHPPATPARVLGLVALSLLPPRIEDLARRTSGKRARNQQPPV